MIELLEYFPDLTDEQKRLFQRLKPLYESWNEKINVISRKDMAAFYEHHVLHSLSIALFCPFGEGLHVLDLGSGGGFPGIPLAILYPDCQFTLVDSIRKKIKVIEAIVEELELKNVEVKWSRAEELSDKYDLVVCRAVAPLSKLLMWINGKVRKVGKGQSPRGLLALKGGDLREEIAPYKAEIKIFDLSDLLNGTFFKEKKLLHLGSDCVYL